MMLSLLQNGPLKLALVLVTSWLGLFTVFITFSAFLRGPEFEHAISIVPGDVVEQRVLPIAALQSLPLSPMNRQILSSMTSPYLTLTFDTTNTGRNAPRLNREYISGVSRNSSVSISIASRAAVPWSTFGVRATDAVLLNGMAHNDDGQGAWNFPQLLIYTWFIPQTQTVHLSLKVPFHPGDEFASLVQTNNTWTVHLARAAQAGAPSRALPFQRTLAIFLWPVLFLQFLNTGGLAGVCLFWVCTMTTGYATLTILLTHWVVRKSAGEVRGQGAARRWEEEGWAIMGVSSEVRREEDVPVKVDSSA